MWHPSSSFLSFSVWCFLPSPSPPLQLLPSTLFAPHVYSPCHLRSMEILPQAIPKDWISQGWLLCCKKDASALYWYNTGTKKSQFRTASCLFAPPGLEPQTNLFSPQLRFPSAPLPQLPPLPRVKTRPSPAGQLTTARGPPALPLHQYFFCPCLFVFVFFFFFFLGFQCFFFFCHLICFFFFFFFSFFLFD